jgi:hypothetical protein
MEGPVMSENLAADIADALEKHLLWVGVLALLVRVL